MKDQVQSFVYLTGAGGGGGCDLAILATALKSQLVFETVDYPGWQRYVRTDFSAANLLAELTAEIVNRVPTGPIKLIGVSIGGHFAYAVALQLLKRGREVALLCAIDSFMVSSAEPSANWQKAALANLVELIRKRRFGEVASFFRSRGWRALLRLAGGRLSGLLRATAIQAIAKLVLSKDKIAEQELSMRLMLREIAPWVATLDVDVEPLPVPVILLRTLHSKGDDAAWMRRCPNIVIHEVPGNHLTLFAPESIQGLRDAFVAAIGQVADLARRMRRS